jgi:DNA-binding LacI/PurR family transcriptional regulator
MLALMERSSDHTARGLAADAPAGSTRAAPIRVRHTPGRPTIAFLLDTLVDPYQESIWESVLEEAAACDVNLLCFLGGRFGDQYEPYLYDLVDPEQIDVLVAVSGSLGSLMNEQDLQEEYRRRFPGMPIISIGQRLSDAPSLVVDNAEGVHQLVAHFVEAHGRRRIAFIRGPSQNAEAETRFRAYREALAHYQIPFEPWRVFQGTWSLGSGVRAVEAFLDERKIELDALLAANDIMAMDALLELKRRGRSVPQDVAVGGFDDIRAAVSAEPSLTTVRQPFHDLGRRAVRNAVALLRGDPVPQVTTFAPTLVVRRSCGCTRRVHAAVASPPLVAALERAGLMTEAAQAALERWLPELGQQVGDPSWARELAEALADELDREADRALPVLERYLARVPAREFQTSSWYSALDAAFAALNGARAEGLGSSGEALWRATIKAVAYRSEQVQERLRAASKGEFEVLSRISFLSQFDQKAMRQNVVSVLPVLGIRSCFLSRFVDRDRSQATLLVHYGAGTKLVLDPELAPFPPRRLFPGHAVEGTRQAFVVVPINAGTRLEPWGFALCELGALAPMAYEILFAQMGTEMRLALLLEGERQHASELETRVEQRTRELREAEGQLLDAARRAGMAEIAIGLMHNVGNLLNSVNVSSDRIRELVRGAPLEGLSKLRALLAEHEGKLPEFFARDPRGGLVGQYLQRIGEELRSQLGSIEGEAGELQDRVSLIRETIATLQAYAREGRDAIPSQPVVIAQTIETALKLQEGNLARQRVEVMRDLSDVPPVMARQAELVHVFVNLIKNAVEAMRNTPPDARRLTVQVRAEGGFVRVRFADAGEGITPENAPRIFTYGFTTKPDGHGFGLHTCANHVRQMGGNIQAESDGPDRGASFVLSFPWPAPQ